MGIGRSPGLYVRMVLYTYSKSALHCLAATLTEFIIVEWIQYMINKQKYLYLESFWSFQFK